MEPSRHLEHLRADGDALLAAAARDLDAPVPTCPDWSAAKLLDHMAFLFRWWSVCLREGRRVKRSAVPPGGDDSVAGYRSALDEVVAVLGATDPEAPSESFAGPAPARWWFRRAAQETVVHRWDAQVAAGTTSPIDPELAADGVDELLDVFLPMVGPKGSGETYHFHATDGPVTDGGGEWLVRLTADGPEVSREHAKGDVAVRATASDLLLLLWTRRTADDLEVFGDASLLERWRELRL